MYHFPIYTQESAPAQSKPVLQSLEKAFGFVPNIAGVMAGSPTLIQGFIALFQRVHAGTFNEAEIQTVLLTDAVANRSSWAAAFHTALALKHGVAASDVQAIRESGVPGDKRLAALSALARELIEKRGHAEPAALNAMCDAGYQLEQVLELVAIVAASTMTNYVGNIAAPPLEDSFREHRWELSAK
jgi:alkylhydroperoxidase family enzyme